MRLRRSIYIVVLSLLVSSCYSRQPPSVGWAYAVGDPILYERPLYPYYSSGNAPGYWGGYAPNYGSGNAPYYNSAPISYTPGYEHINQVGVVNVVNH